jgi:oligopeptide/dipeptide ABC transporter ATP-binding protein
MKSGSPLLVVEDLRVRFETRERTVHAVNGVSFQVFPGETLGIVGESGSGKTVTVLSLLGLVPSPPAQITAGRAVFSGQDLLAMGPDELRTIRGKDVAVVFQDPMTSLNPVIRVGEQLREALWTHDLEGDDSAHRRRAVELLALVGVPQPERRYHQYPHEFSGGMRQRAMIAMAIANRPRLLIADEPTTALDVTIQAQVLDVLMAAKAETGAATVLITHDLGLVAQVADRVVVMYGGRIVEQGSISDIFLRPSHPYTIGLLASLPSIDGRQRRLYSIPGQPPRLDTPPVGCSFEPRCEIGSGRSTCATEPPPLVEIEVGHRAECHFIVEAVEWAKRPVGEGGGRP